MPPATITAALFDTVTDWSQPMLTFYDDASGERTELSAATLGNWAAKTANYLIDELGATDADPVIVDLPHHWQTAAILLGAWWAGTDVLPVDSTTLGSPTASEEPLAVFTAAARVDAWPDADTVVVASLDPFAMPARHLPPGIDDFATSVRVHADQFTPPVVGGSAALAGRPSSEVLAAAANSARTRGVTSGARVLSTRRWSDADAIVDDLIAILGAGASLISVANADPDRLAGKAETEKATLTLN